MADHNNTETNIHRNEALQRKLAFKEERKHHNVSFIMMILLTLVAFYAIWSDKVADSFAVLFILVLAVVQVFFQLYIWMHLSHKGHDFPLWGMFSGILIAAITVVGIAGMIWTS
ncbi:cytochrome C oxidase subunit IV family protein [Fictibacillus enclensis]|uniref:Cytochrome c oxidase subunit 4 n=1 Tax=Fictibacillus solisalsi TaxID=459525 RepID=A0A1G9UR44_9BACL|nr:MULTISPECIES: cytochrome C oxidase subunit IV family protein [Fictibacillus]MDM5198737.1 cytochrome C oxidase subunit IV family protein [Fictibacillus enclensis]SDM62303.1 cytochrome c oxidase subunit 4 [Fictibacillus solisalsi]